MPSAAEPNKPPLIWEARYAATPPSIDGRIDEVWTLAKPLTVGVREALGGGSPVSVMLRALYTDDTLYVLAQWPDTTPSVQRDPYVWNPQTKEYDRPTKPDDQFCVHCGQQLVARVPTCPACRGYVRSRDRYCIWCGNDLQVLNP